MAPRVVHVSASFPRSAEDANVPFLLDLVALQRGAGWDASVVALHDERLPIRDEVEGVPVRRARYAPDSWERLAYRGGLVHSLGSPGRAALLPAAVTMLAATTVRDVRAAQPDVVHAHWLVPGGLAAVAAARLGRAPQGDRPRVVVTLHGSDVELAAARPAVRRLGRSLATRADAVLAVSEPLAARAEDVLDLPPGTVGVARLPLSPGLEPSPLPAGPPRLLAAGRASREKGFDVLVDALSRPEVDDWSATIVADGPERRALEAIVTAHRLDDRVTFLPLQPRAALFDLIRAHHVVAVPSRAEGLGMIALEALALGRPVVASAVGGLVEVVAPGDDGALVAPGDPDALAKAIATVRLDPPVGGAVAGHAPGAVLDAHREAYALLGTDSR